MAAKTISYLRLYGYVIVGEYGFILFLFETYERYWDILLPKRLSRFSLAISNLPACCNAQNSVSACERLQGLLVVSETIPREQENIPSGDKHTNHKVTVPPLVEV